MSKTRSMSSVRRSLMMVAIIAVIFSVMLGVGSASATRVYAVEANDAIYVMEGAEVSTNYGNLTLLPDGTPHGVVEDSAHNRRNCDIRVPYSGSLVVIYGFYAVEVPTGPAVLVRVEDEYPSVNILHNVSSFNAYDHWYELHKRQEVALVAITAACQFYESRSAGAIAYVKGMRSLTAVKHWVEITHKKPKLPKYPGGLPEQKSAVAGPGK